MDTVRDPVSGAPLPFLSLAVRYFFPDEDDYEENKHLTQPYVTPGAEPITDQYFTTGSLSEDLNLPYIINRVTLQHIGDADLDAMLSIDLQPGFTLETSKSDSSLLPGYCYISYYNAADASSKLRSHLTAINQKFYISSSYVNRCCVEVFEQFYLKLPQTERMDDGKDDVTHPAVTFKMVNRSMDVVPCFSAPWPDDANEWNTRKRKANWPNKETLNEIANAGCHLVSKAHPLSCRSEIQWRFSFSAAEKTLAQSLTSSQKICYKVFKALVKYHPNTCTSDIATYLLKTTLFWVCESVPQGAWTTSSLGTMLMCLLDRFLNFLADHNLPNYFISRANLIDHLPGEVIQRWRKCISVIRSDPLGAMVDFQAVYSSSHHTGLLPHNIVNALELLRQVANEMRQMEYNLVCLRTALRILGVYYAADSRHQMVLSLGRVFLPLITSDDIIIADELPLQPADELFVLRYMYEQFIDAVNADDVYTYRPNATGQLKHLHKHMVLSALYTELACIHHQSGFLQDISDQDRNEHDDKAMEYFHTAVRSDQSTLSARVKYAQYLMQTSGHDSALPILIYIVKTTDFPLQFRLNTWVSYSRFTTYAMDEVLRTDVMGTTEVNYQAHALAYYLLNKCCSESKGDIPVPTVDELHGRYNNDANLAIHEAEFLYFEGCLLLSFDQLYPAVWVFIKACRHGHWKSYYKAWLCIAKMYNLMKTVCGRNKALYLECNS